MGDVGIIKDLLRNILLPPLQFMNLHTGRKFHESKFILILKDSVTVHSWLSDLPAVAAATLVVAAIVPVVFLVAVAVVACIAVVASAADTLLLL